MSRRDAGQKYFVADADVFTLRQRIEAIAAYLGHRFDFCDLPYPLAWPCHPLWRRTRESSVRDSGRIRRELGYQDRVGAAEAMRRTVDWLVARSDDVAETERQHGDPFDYAAEDGLIARWERVLRDMGEPAYALPAPSHIYRHPTAPAEGAHEARS